MDPATSSITFNTSFQVPGIYIGGRLTGTAAMKNAGVAVEGQYQLLFSGGTASFANVPVVADGLFGRITLALYIGPGANPLVGTVTNIYPDTTTFLGSGINAAGRAIADGMSMTLAYTSNRIDLSGLTYAHDPSNMIIREMIFSDQLSFTPSTTRWDFNPISMGMPLFSFTSMVTPAGTCCSQVEWAYILRCVTARTRPAPSVVPDFHRVDVRQRLHRNSRTWPAAPMMTRPRAFHTSTAAGLQHAYSEARAPQRCSPVNCCPEFRRWRSAP